MLEFQNQSQMLSWVKGALRCLNGDKRLAVFLCIALLSQFYSPSAPAEVYKYKDEYGNWKFSDKPPESERKVEQLNIGTSGVQTTEALPEDVEAHLVKKYSPRTAIEKTTLAVLSIETSLGSGSGFFISDNGYIVTNKHVVRPTENRSWREASESYDDAEEKLALAEKQLAGRKVKIDKMEKELADYKRDIDDRHGEDKKVAMSEYEIYRERLQRMKDEYEKNKEYIARKKREFRSSSSDFSNRTTRAKFAQQFKITLKDGSEKTARLINLSKEHDLALLKLEGHHTPYLNIDSVARPGQGMKVYAMGSPLGLKDFVTSGIITRVRSDGIVTDTQILPGNSGGPLTDEVGNVLGINTLKLSSTRSADSEGFGIAIPVEFLRQEFGRYLNNSTDTFSSP